MAHRALRGRPMIWRPRQGHARWLAQDARTLAGHRGEHRIDGKARSDRAASGVAKNGTLLAVNSRACPQQIAGGFQRGKIELAEPSGIDRINASAGSDGSITSSPLARSGARIRHCPARTRRSPCAANQAAAMPMA
jgi:hypothetical protein